MEFRPYRTRQQTFFYFYLWLGSLCVSIHCVTYRPLDNVPSSVLREESEEPKDCFLEIFSYIEAKNQKAKKIFYPTVIAVIRNQKICFTETAQDVFNKGSTKNISLAGCEILYNITNISNSSCKWLQGGLRKLRKENQTLISVVLSCEKQQFPTIIAASRRISDNKDLRLNNCLPESKAFMENTTSTSKETPSDKHSLLNYFKGYLAPFLAASGGLLFILFLLMILRHIGKQKTNSANSCLETEPEQVDSPERSCTSPETDDDHAVYHEPNFHSYINIEDGNRRDYEYAYGHLDPARRSYVIGAQNRENKRNYVNIEEIHDVRNKNAEEYVDMNRDDDYTPLDRSNMIDDSTRYQGLLEQNYRPKPAPRSGLRQSENIELSYVKVI